MSRWILRVAVALILIAGGLYGLAWITTDHFGMSRALIWRDADTGDIHRFPARVIRADTVVTELPVGDPVDLSELWSVDNAEAFLEETATTAFIVVQDEMVRYEGYFNGASPDDQRTSFSVAKSVVSTLMGLAIQDGTINSADDAITTYIPELLDKDTRFADITIRHLMSMSSGLRYDERSLPWSDDTETYYGTDLRAIALTTTVEDEPGSTFHYNNFNLLLEGLILERAIGMPIAEYASERLWIPMGAEADASWSLDSHDSGFEKMESGLNALARDYARFGMLFANDGQIGERQVISPEWVRAATTTNAGNGPADFYGFHWWTGQFGQSPFPDGHFMAAGNLGQFIYVAPEQNIVIVRLGDDEGGQAWPERMLEVVDQLGEVNGS